MRHYEENYTDRDGLKWESRAEHDGAIAAGKFIDAALAWQRGERRFRPRRKLYALRYGVLNYRETLREIEHAVSFQRRFGVGQGRLDARV